MTEPGKTELTGRNLAKRSHEFMQDLSKRDSLTGLFNRRYATERFQQAASGNNLNFGIAIFDVDYFKKINDTYGHSAGDLVLKHIARTLSEHTRLREEEASDFVARWGGEEFVLFVPRSGDLPQAAEKLRKDIENSLLRVSTKRGLEDIKMTVSIGVAKYHATDRGSWEKVLDRADTGLYLAKEQGRNKLVEVI